MSGSIGAVDNQIVSLKPKQPSLKRNHFVTVDRDSDAVLGSFKSQVEPKGKAVYGTRRCDSVLQRDIDHIQVLLRQRQEVAWVFVSRREARRYVKRILKTDDGKTS